ncbi:zinc finger protein 280C-like isoform X2 [Centruroides vittatus]|uniref:zinc finger protein 280C-like isoform X2 n=1 Tax=Centruroides vittatus TaxID=120091 RepID=UPI00350F487F
MSDQIEMRDMSTVCSVHGCNSDYRSNGEHVTLFAVPEKEPDRSIWSQGVKTDFRKLKNPVVCLRHFDESLILRYETVLINDKERKFCKKIPVLKAGATPTILPDVFLNVQESNCIQKKEEISEPMIVSKANEIIGENHQLENTAANKLTVVSCFNNVAHESDLSIKPNTSSVLHYSNSTLEPNVTAKENPGNIGLMMECNEELLTQTQLTAYQKMDQNDDNIMKSLINSSTDEIVCTTNQNVISANSFITSKPIDVNVPVTSTNLNIPPTTTVSNLPILNKTFFITPLTPPIMPISKSTTTVNNNSPVFTSGQIKTTTTIIVGTNTSTNVISKMPILCLPKETFGLKQTPIMIAQSPIQVVQRIPQRSILLPKTSTVTNLNNATVNTLATTLLNNKKTIANSCKVLVDIKTGAIIGTLNVPPAVSADSENKSPVIGDGKSLKLSAVNENLKSSTETAAENNQCDNQTEKKCPDTPGTKLSELENYYYACRQPRRKICIPSESHLLFKCLKCRINIKNNVNFMNHVFGDMDIERGKKSLYELTECNYCFRFFATCTAMQHHIKNVHLKANSIMCKICNQEFTKIEKLSNHLKEVHVQNEMPYLCYICYYRTSFHQDILNHFYELHNETEKLLCQYCLKVFEIQFSTKGVGSTEEYFFHLQKHHERDVRKQCKACCLSFISSSELAKHILRDHKKIAASKGVSSIKLDSDKFFGQRIPKKFNKQLFLTEESLNRPSSVCCECGHFMNAMHFGRFLNCGTCKYSTHCSKAFVNHMIYKHTKVKKNTQAKRILKPIILEDPAVCKCSFYSFRGNVIAKHLAKCKKFSCQIVLKKNIISYLAKLRSKRNKLAQSLQNKNTNAVNKTSSEISKISVIENKNVNNAIIKAVLEGTKTANITNQKVENGGVRRSDISQFLQNQTTTVNKMLTEAVQSCGKVKEQEEKNNINFAVKNLPSVINVNENTQFHLVPLINTVAQYNSYESIERKEQEDCANIIKNSEMILPSVVRTLETDTSKNTFMDVDLDEESLYFEIEENTDANSWDEIEIVND